MRKPLIWVFAMLAGMSLLVNCGRDAVQMDEEGEFVVEVGELNVHFERIEPISETYMIFGGQYLRHKNAISSVSLSTLSMEDARPIYANYPDFHMCASPGAALAKEAVGHMNIIPANSDVMDSLKEVLSEHRKSLQEGGDRVCVRLEGATLEMTAAIVPKVNEDIIDELPSHAFSDYVLVELAEIVDAQTALEGS